MTLEMEELPFLADPGPRNMWLGVKTGAELMLEPPPLRMGRELLIPSMDLCPDFLLALESSSSADTGELP